MAQPLICKYFWQLKIKLSRVRARWRNAVIIPVKTIFCFRAVSTALMPSLFGMFVYRERTSNVTRMLILGILSKLLIFRMKSVESLTYDLSSFTYGCNTWSIYFDNFLVWQSTKLTTSLPGFPFLWIFGNILNCGIFASELFRLLVVFSSKRPNVSNSSILILALVLFSSVVSFGN